MNLYIRNTVCSLLVAILFSVAFFSFTSTARADSTSSLVEQIQALLVIIEQLQSQITQLQGGSSPDTQCIQLSRSLFFGSSDKDSAGEVSKLQRFLTSTGHYTYGEITGYYGPVTQRAVQAWQSAKGVVSYGSPETTGYGVAGPSTRSMMARSCNVSTPVATPVSPVTQSDAISVSISSISNSENPMVKGWAYGTDAIGFSVGNGDKVYGSGDIQIVNNRWAHKISTDLEDGRYILTVYVDNYEVARKSFGVYTTKTSCTIKTSENNPAIGEKFTVTWTTENIENPAFNEGMKAGGSYNVSEQGKLSFYMSSAYTATFGISEQLDENNPLCVVKVTAIGDDYADLDVQTYTESTLMILNTTVQGKKLLSFTVDADNAAKNVTLNEVSVYIGLPYVKAGLWSDMIKNVILVSEKTQQSVNMSSTVETNLGGVQLKGVDHDEILVTFDLSDYIDYFTIPKGVTRDFTVIVDFNPANTVGGFGHLGKGISAGYVQAVVGEVEATTEVKRGDTEGPVIYIKGNSY